jgi:hypothetical protein
VNIDEVVWDPSIYPRSKWNTSTIDRYVDALEAGDTFPPVTLEKGTLRLLDGKHRLEAHKKAGRAEIDAEEVEIPEGMSARYFAATLSARHGDRMSNADLKALAEVEFKADPTLEMAEWGRNLGVSKGTLHGWVGSIVNRGLEERRAKSWRLHKLGWIHEEIAAVLDVSRPTIVADVKEFGSELPDIRDALAKGLDEADVAARWNLPIQLVWAMNLTDATDTERLQSLGIKTQPFDVWQFPGCHDLMGDRHPGRIPGELVAHVLYFLTNPGDLVIDPMAGSGTTLDAALLMGRKARGYDIDHRHDRVDIEQHDVSEGWPDITAKADLVFWDPPYFDKMDHSTIGDDGYIEGSISGLDPDGYIDWFTKRFHELRETVKPGTRLAFLMSDWDPQNAKQHGDHPGLFLWDYADRLRETGWTLQRQIQCPLSTQQVHPDIVNKFRAAKRLARLERWLLVAVA